MLSTNDFLEKQFLVINSDEYRNLCLKNENLAIYKFKRLINQISCHKIFCIFVISDCTITTKLVNRLLEFWISIYFLSTTLKPKFVIWNVLEWNYILRQKQYSLTNDIQLSRIVVNNKISNQQTLLKKIREKDENLKSWIKRLEEALIFVDNCKDTDSLRWIEWNCSKIFFSLYFKNAWWLKRMPRTRFDIINLLMDIWYTFIYNFVESNLNIYWFDIYKWFYHKLFFERKSLVCDLVEAFRCLIDEKIKKMYNLWQVKEDDFIFTKWEYWLKIDKRWYYIENLLEPIIENKQSIFEYVKWYYKFLMKEDVNFFKDFKI